MYCIKCGSRINDTARFCKNCGALNIYSSRDSLKQQALLSCVQCGNPIREGIKFCGKCGAPANTSDGPGALYNNTAEGNGQQYQNSAPYTVQALSNRSTPGIKGKKHLKYRYVIAVVLIFAFFITVYVKREAIMNLPIFDDSSTLLSNTNRRTPPKPALSGTKAFDITPVDGIRLTAAENALDKERTFKVTRFNDDQMLSMLKDFHTEDIPVAAFKIDGGMKDDEYLPGCVNVTLDLEKLQVPKEMWDRLGVYRIDESGNRCQMVMKREGSNLKWEIRKNSVFVTTLLLGLLSVTASGAYIYESSTKFSDEYSGKVLCDNLDIEIDTGEKTYAYFRMVWSEKMAPGNPKAIEDVAQAKLKIMKRHGWDEGKKEWNVPQGKYYADRVNELYKRVVNDPEYIELKKLCQSYEWKRDNFWPEIVYKTSQALKNASVYLFVEKRFKKPWYRMDIMVRDTWTPGDDALGEEKDKALTFPYVTVNGTKAPVDMTDLNLTILHEVFHAVQKEYYRYDYKQYIWFMEAEALTLEYEANNDYVKYGWNPSLGILKERDDFETFRVPLPDPGNNDKVARRHGYTLSLFLDYIRNDTGLYKKYKSELVKDIMSSFSGFFATPVSAIYDGAGITPEELGLQFKKFCSDSNIGMGDNVFGKYRDPNQCRTDKSLLDDMKQDVNGANPLFIWRLDKIKPLSADYRMVSLSKVTAEQLKDGILYVVNGRGQSFKSWNIYHNIKGYYAGALPSGSNWKAFENDAIAYNTNLLQDVAIQRVDTNVEGVDFSQSSKTFIPIDNEIKVILMLKPKEASVAYDSESGILKVEIEQSELKKVLKQRGLKVSYEVKIVFPGIDKPYMVIIDSEKQSAEIDIRKEKEGKGQLKGLTDEGLMGLSATYKELVKISDILNLIGPESKKSELENTEPITDQCYCGLHKDYTGLEKKSVDYGNGATAEFYINKLTGKEEGLFKGYSSGKLTAIGCIHEGKDHGRWQTFYASGSPKSEWYAIKGLPDPGKQKTEWYENGNVKSIESYNAKAEKNGTCLSYHENGQMFIKAVYDNGKIISRTVWDKNGKDITNQPPSGYNPLEKQ